MDSPNHLICHLISCSAFPTALSIPLPSLIMKHSVQIKKKKQPTRYQYFTLLITLTSLLLVD
jgi:hypothetical protein